MTYNNRHRYDCNYGGTQCGEVYRPKHRNDDCVAACPPFEPEEETISTGPLHLVPADNRAEIFISNPTNCPAVVTVEVSVCIAPPTAGTPIAGAIGSFATRETRAFGPAPITLAAGDCFEAAIALPPGTNIVDVTFTGPFVICDSEPAQGGVEASVGIGAGRVVGGVQQVGLATITTFVPFGDLVLAAEADNKHRY